MMPDQAMILAAGMGARMRPLTDRTPKPMIEVNGRPIIGYAIDALQNLGIAHIAANTHYLPGVLDPYLQSRGVAISHEETLLDTGGGIKNALAHFDVMKPLLVLSGDSILVGGDGLRDLAQAWNPDAMDICLLLQPLETMIATPGIGDYDVRDGRPVRSPDRTGAYMWTSARILNPHIFESAPDGAFSFLPLMDAAQKAGRLGCAVHKGVWHHLTTPADIRAVEDVA